MIESRPNWRSPIWLAFFNKIIEFSKMVLKRTIISLIVSNVIDMLLKYQSRLNLQDTKKY